MVLMVKMEMIEQQHMVDMVELAPEAVEVEVDQTSTILQETLVEMVDQALY